MALLPFQAQIARCRELSRDATRTTGSEYRASSTTNMDIHTSTTTIETGYKSFIEIERQQGKRENHGLPYLDGTPAKNSIRSG